MLHEKKSILGHSGSAWCLREEFSLSHLPWRYVEDDVEALCRLGDDAAVGSDAHTGEDSKDIQPNRQVRDPTEFLQRADLTEEHSLRHEVSAEGK